MNILIADDHDIIRLGLKQLLESRSGWKICAEAATGTEAVTLAKQFEPHVVVMDIGMPELNGLEATRKICKLLPGTKIVVLTMHFSDQLVHDIVEAKSGDQCQWSAVATWACSPRLGPEKCREFAIRRNNG